MIRIVFRRRSRDQDEIRAAKSMYKRLQNNNHSQILRRLQNARKSSNQNIDQGQFSLIKKNLDPVRDYPSLMQAGRGPETGAEEST